MAGYRRLGWFGRMRRGPLGPPIAALLALILFVPAFHDSRGFHYLGQYRRARSEARSVESAFPTLEALLEKAVNASPRSEFRIELGRLYTEMARVANDSGRDEEREAFCDRAASAYERAIAANPVHAFTYYETGLVYLLSNYPLMTYADRAKTYFRKALELKPADDFLNLNVTFLNFSWWPTLENAEKVYAAGLYRQAVARDPAFPAKLEARWKQSHGTSDALAAILAELQ
jgi:tetratricopeptide (TPR) repeat protein